MGRNQELRPQDVLVLARLIIGKSDDWRQVEIAKELGLSQAEISFSLERLYLFGLIFNNKKEVKKDAAFEFLGTAVKYLYPPKFLGLAHGLPTTTSAKPLSKDLVKIDEVLVWESAFGNQKGIALKPLYESVPEAASKNKKLYELLTVIDAIRSENGRVLELAKKHLKNFIEGNIDE